MKNKCIVIGVSGGIAAYKICTLVSSLKKKGNDVHVLMTKSATEFVGPLTFQTLSQNRVILDMFSVDFEVDVHHISLAKKADLFVLAPASANIIAKVANGIADDMLTTTFLAATCPKVIVPAMNTNMLENPITQENLEKCRKYGMHILESGDGYLACGDVGKGRLPEAEEIEDAIEGLFEKDHFLKGKKIMISAGPTREDIDPVRYITNHSSGKMGFALAKAARNAGAEVTLVSGPCNLKTPSGIERIEVSSAEEMAKEIIDRQEENDVIILAAAVADYRPKEKALEKMKKSDDDLSISLVRTKDILKTLGEKKKKHQILIGFAMETENLLENAQKKLVTKNVDYIVANSLREEGAGFGVDTNKVTILSINKKEELPLLSKEEVAERILAYCTKGE
ncbi:MAG: bifunctional phosphopantothenoylcysteine decarboxylase/phosphopantothenate--cysteine ligase CoaBC [Solobacterium sp.]|nr:bifunctional phosphopantothenoylcysteine decarboxylase/phosphopantothenate--cysteine ligase CoaBC [Solobacterium sp.]